jgi:hypothetical protein
VGFSAASLGIVRTPLATAAWPWRLAAAYAALTVTLRILPRPAGDAPAIRRGNDLPWRMLATAMLVVAMTGLARALGPSLSGLFTPFPIATSVLVVFAHRESGAAGVAQVYRGFIPSLYSFASFCAALAYMLGHWVVPTAFALALLVSLLSQTIVLGVVRRAPARAANEARL